MERLQAILARLPLPVGTAPAGGHGDPAPAACPRCRGQGYLRLGAPVGHPDFGRIVPCGCRQPAGAAAPHPGLPGDTLAVFAAQTFASFDPAVPGTAAACAVCQAYAGAPSAGWS
jgi:DNA replication protein DnaC